MTVDRLIVAGLLLCSTVTPSPTFYEIHPDRGPLDGGTVITFNASIAQHLRPSQVLLHTSDNTLLLSLTVHHLDRVKGTFRATTSRPPAASIAGSHTVSAIVSVMFNNETTMNTGFIFTFIDGPTITSISPHQYVYTGGTLVTVNGQDLDVSLLPQLHVKTVRRTANNNDNEENAYYQQLCEVVNSTRLLCPLPTLLLRPQVKRYFDSFNSLSDSFTATLSPSLIDNLTSTSPPLTLSTSSSPADSLMMTVVVGFIFDNNNYYKYLPDVLPSQTMTIVPAPVITTDTTPAFIIDRWLINRVTIHGLYLRRGCDVSDYRVYIDSNLSCTVVELSHTELTVEIPSLRHHSINPTKPASRCHGNDLPLTVYVGVKVYPHVACVHVNSKCDLGLCRNGATCVDHWDSFNCSCASQYYGHLCQFAYPVISGLWPNYGPLSGGTAITVYGSTPSAFQPTGLYIGSHLFAALNYRTTDYWTVVSPRTDLPHSNLTLLVNYVWNDSMAQSSVINMSAGDVQFSYRPDPNITRVYPLQHLYTGGTLMLVVGEHLDSVASPTLDIVVSVRVNGGLITITNTHNNVCKPVSSSQLDCVLPSFSLPSHAISSLDTDNYTPSPSYGSARSLPLPSNATGTCLTSPVSGERSAHVQLSVQFGLTFDGLTTYSDYGQLQLYAPPRLCFNQSYVTFQVIVNNSIYITGEHLLRGCTWRDYRVMIEDVQCQVTYLDNTTLGCLPAYNQTPSLNYTHSPSWPCPPHYQYHITVDVGNERYEVGCVDYDYESTDYCIDVVCQHNATCLNTLTEAVCQCTPQYYGQLCQHLSPVLDSLYPTYGVVAGGTVVTINGSYEARITPVAVYFGDWETTEVIPLPAEWSNYSSVVITRTPAANETTRLVNVSVKFNDSSVFRVVQQFNYRPSPRLMSVHPRDQLRSGGTHITLTGSNMDVALKPSLSVTVIVERRLDVDHVSVNDINALSLECDVLSPVVIRCLMPYCTVPEDFVPFLDVDAVDKKQIGYVSSRDVESSSNSDSVVQKKTSTMVKDVHVTLSGGEVMTTYVQLTFDNLKLNASKQLNNATLLLHNKPVIKPPTSIIKIYANTSQIVQIEGQNLTIGCAEDDYTVYLDDTKCDLLIVFYDRLQFMPPDDPPTTTTIDNGTSVYGYECKDDDDSTYVYHIRVRIGDTTYSAGCAMYASTEAEQQYIDWLLGQMMIYLLVAVFGSVLFVILLAVSIRS